MAERKNISGEWGHHPLVASVLWILGSGSESALNNRESNTSPTNVLKWKDETGGSINEYFSHVQIAGSDISGKHDTSSSQQEEKFTQLPRTSNQLGLINPDNSTISTDATAAINDAHAPMIISHNFGTRPAPGIHSNLNATNTNSTGSGGVETTIFPPGGADATTPSPQWGFYVPITPPEQEMFGKKR